jgi:hypothetical protein
MHFNSRHSETLNASSSGGIKNDSLSLRTHVLMDGLYTMAEQPRFVVPPDSMMHDPLSRTTKWETGRKRKSVRTGNRQYLQRRCMKILKGETESLLHIHEYKSKCIWHWREAAHTQCGTIVTDFLLTCNIVFFYPYSLYISTKDTYTPFLNCSAHTVVHRTTLHVPVLIIILLMYNSSRSLPYTSTI